MSTLHRRQRSPPASVVLLPMPEGIVAVQRADNGHLALPGGRRERGEFGVQAASRELWEETGLCVDPQELFWLVRTTRCEVFGACWQAVRGKLTSSWEGVALLASAADLAAAQDPYGATFRLAVASWCRLMS